MKTIIISLMLLVIASSGLCEQPFDPFEPIKIKSETIRIVTAYNAGDPAQTDSDPCIAANNKDICKMLEEGMKLCAANFVPLGTKLWIEGLGLHTVVDRTNKRYKNRVDIAMMKHEKPKALKFGRKKLLVKILH